MSTTKTATFREHDGVWALQGTDLTPGDLVEVHKRGGEVVER